MKREELLSQAILNNLSRSFVKLASILFPYMVSISIYFTSLEIYTYPGQISQSIFIDLRLFLAITIFTGFISIYTKKEKTKQNNLSDLVFNLNRLVFPVLLIFYFTLLSSNHSKYSNYIFSTYHLHLSRIKLLVIFSLYLFALDLFRPFSGKIKRLLSNKSKKKQYVVIINLITILVIFAFVLGNVLSFIQHFIQNYQLMIKYPLATNDKKSSLVLGDYDYFNFLADYSDDNAVIAIPPQMSPWYTVGNGGYLRYFVYPKKVINSPLNGPIPPEANYAVIAKGNWNPGDESLYGWPKETIKAEKIWYFDRDKKKVEQSSETVFNPNKNDNKNKWGLIKLKK